MTGEIVEYARRRTGQHLRIIGSFSGYQIRLGFVREDIDRQRARGTTRLLVESFVEEAEDEGLQQALGPQDASLHIFSRVCVVHIPPVEDSGSGLLMVLDREAGSNLSDFVEGCVGQWRE